VKIVARTQNPVSSQDKPTQTLCGEINRSNLHLVSWAQLSGAQLSGWF